MTSIQWQRVGEGQWKAVGTKASMHVPIFGLASLPEDIQSQIKSYIPKESHPLAECIDDFIWRMARIGWRNGFHMIDWETGMSMIGENAQHLVYKLFWVNDHKKQFKVEHRQLWYCVPWNPDDEGFAWTYPYNKFSGEHIHRWLRQIMRKV